MRRFTLMFLGMSLVVVIIATVPYVAEMRSQVAVGINVGIALLVLIVGLVLIRRTNHRLAHLASVAMALQEGDFSARSNIVGVDAIGLLAKAFNSMAEKIQSSFQQLEHHHQELERSQNLLAQQNSRLEKEFKRQASFNEYLVALHAIDIRVIARSAMRYMMSLADIQMGVFYLWDEVSSKLTRCVEMGLDENALVQLDDSLTAQGLPLEVFRRAELIGIKHIDKEALPSIHLGFSKAHIRSVVGIPVIFRQKALGVLVFASLHDLDEQTQKMIEGMVGALGNALNNALTYRMVEEQAMRLEEANRKLMTVDQFRCEFVANMSHELRTPLNAIIGFSGLLMKNRSGSLDQSSIEYAEKINRNGRRLLDMINDILDLSKIDAGHMDLHLGPVSIEEIIEEVLELFKSEAEEKGLSLRYHGMPGIPIIQSDAEKLRRIIINLVSNALKFTAAGEVCVRSRIGDLHDGVLVEVQDSGIGIPPDKLDRIFEPFHQLDSGMARQYGGTGLGLTITRALVELLGGTIHVTSVPSRGTIFKICLPSLGEKKA